MGNQFSNSFTERMTKNTQKIVIENQLDVSFGYKVLKYKTYAVCIIHVIERGLDLSPGLGDCHIKRESGSGHDEREHGTTGGGGRERDGGGGDGEWAGEENGAGGGAAAVVGALAQFLDGEASLGRRGAVFRGEGRRAQREKTTATRGARGHDRLVGGDGGRRGGLLLFLALVAEPHPHLFGEEVQLLGYRLDGLSVGARVLMEEAVQRGFRLRREDGALLALPRGHHGRLGGVCGDGLWELCLL